MENVFPYRHPYAGDVIGTPEDLRATTLEDVKSFFRQYYAPNNAVLLMLGDVDPKEGFALARRYFEDIPPNTSIPRADVERLLARWRFSRAITVSCRNYHPATWGV